MTLDLSALLVPATEDEIYTTALGIATQMGLPVSSWQPGDPTRSLYRLQATILAALEQIVIGYIGAGFLDSAAANAIANPQDPEAQQWLNVLAQQVFGITVPAATYATASLVLANTGGGLYVIAPGDLTFKSSLTGMTYHNTTGGTLTSGPGTTLTVTVEADLPGSVSSAAAYAIDTMVTTLLGVTCNNGTVAGAGNALAAVGTDAQDPNTTVTQCRASLGALSPNGPSDAFSFVAMSPTLTGSSNINRARAFGNSTTGAVTVYLASPSGGAASTDVALANAAIQKWATPLCVTPTVLAASNVTVNVTYQLWIYASSGLTVAAATALVQTALNSMFANEPIGGDIPAGATGYLHQSLIAATIKGISPLAFKVAVSLPSGDVALANNQVAVLGTVTPTITLVAGP